MSVCTCFGTFLILLHVLHAQDLITAVGGGLHYHNMCSDHSLQFSVSSHTQITLLTHMADRNAVVYLADRKLFLLSLENHASSSLIADLASMILEDLAVWDNNTLVATDVSQPALIQVSLSSSNENNNNSSGEISVLMALESDSRPRGVTVDRTNNILYWADWRHGSQSVRRCRLRHHSTSDGGGGCKHSAHVLVSDSLYLPAGVAVDTGRRRLYLADLSPQQPRVLRVESVDSDSGRLRRLVHSAADRWRHTSPPRLQLLADTLYWFDSAAVWALSLSHQHHTVTRLLPLQNRPTSVVALPAKHACKHNQMGTTVSYNTAAAAADTHHCSPLLCLNGGQCVADDSHGLCVCRPGYSGDRCQLDQCWQLCLNGGTCVRPVAVSNTRLSSPSSSPPHCQCARGTSGTRCQVIVNSTSVSPRVHSSHQQLHRDQTASAVSTSLPLNLSVEQLSCAVTILLTTSVVLLLTLMGVVLLNIRRRWLCNCSASDSLVLNSPPPSTTRRVVGVPRVVLKAATGGATVRRDIEDCCQMTLCERPCEVRIKSLSNRRHAEDSFTDPLYVLSPHN